MGIWLGVGDGALMVGKIWLRCPWRPTAFGSWEVLTKRILDPTASKIWGSGQMWAGFVYFEKRCRYEAVVPLYDHLPGRGECPALITLQATQQSQKERVG